MRTYVMCLAVLTLMTCLAHTSMTHTVTAAEAKKIVLIAGTKSHGFGSHEHRAGCMLLAKSLQLAMPNYKCEVVPNGFPADESIFEGADAVICYADGGGRHPFNPHLKKIDALAAKGVGIGCIHYAVETVKGDAGDHFLKWMGGYFEPHWSVNPHWVAKFEEFPKHEVTSGVGPFEMNDEWYYHMRFRPGMKGVTPILTDMPGPETLRRGDGAHSGNPEVRAAVLERKEPQHLMWLSETGDQRGFGFTGGHFHWNWGDEDFRKIVLNAVVWIAHGEVPEGGVSDQVVTVEQLEKNQDYGQPANYSRESIVQQYKLKSSEN